MTKSIKKITKSELEKIYYGNDQKTASKILGVSALTMRKYVKEMGIKMKGAGCQNHKKRTKIELVK